MWKRLSKKEKEILARFTRPQCFGKLNDWGVVSIDIECNHCLSRELCIKKKIYNHELLLKPQSRDKEIMTKYESI